MSDRTYQSDRPISSRLRDDLRRGTFSAALAKAVYDYDDPESIAIGLFGDWGTGKTSALSLFEKALADYPEGYNAPYVINFNPWRITTDDQLFTAFFASLAAAIDTIEARPWWRRTWDFLLSRIPWSNIDALDVPKASELISRYAVALAGAHALGAAGAVAGSVALAGVTLGSAAKAFLSFARSRDDIETLKSAISARLSKLDRRLVIVLDDVDRLAASEVRQVFQLVKSVADFNNTIYILALDWNVVEAALSGVQGVNGREYLKKIVQINCELPRVAPEKLNDMFVTRFNKIIDDYDGTIEQERFNKVYLGAASGLIKTARDISRVLNTYRFLYRLLRNDVNLIDLLGITIISVLQPGLYYYIRDNEDLFCDSVLLDYDEERRKELQDGFAHVLEDVPDNQREAARATVYALFPAFADRLKERRGKGRVDNSAEEARWERDLRISASVRFSTYFAYAVSEDDVSQSDVAAMISGTPDEAGTSERLLRFVSEGKDDAVISELQLHRERIPPEGVLPLLRILQMHGDEFKGRPTRQGLFFLDTAWRVKNLSLYLLRRLKAEDRATALKALFLESDTGIATQSAFVGVLGDIRVNHDQGKRGEYYSDPLIEPEDLAALVRVIAGRIRDLVASKRLFSMVPSVGNRDVIMLVALWLQWEGKDILAPVFRDTLDLDSFEAVIRLFTTPGHRTQTVADMHVITNILGDVFLREQIDQLPNEHLTDDTTLAEGVFVLRRVLDGASQHDIAFESLTSESRS